jgi:hypothetical protein
MGIDENSIDTIYFKPKKDLDEIKDYCSESNSNNDFVINPTSSFFGCRAEANFGDLANEKLKNTSAFINQITLDETEEEKNLDQFNKKDKKKIFDVIYPEKNYKILTENEINPNSLDLFESFDFNKKTRSKVKQRRFTNQDNMRRVIKRRFTNTYLKNKFNKKLKKAGYKKFIECFPQEFAGNVTREINSSIINMTFGQILTDKSIYSGKKLYQYENNLEIVNLIKKDQNSALNEMLNKKFSELFEEYLNSDEFKIGEIQRLLNATKPKSGKYIQKYEYLAKNLIKFFANTD